MKTLKPFFKPFAKQMAIMAVLYILSTVTSILMPDIMSKMVTNGIGEKNLNYILIQGGIMLALAVVAIVAATINTRLNARVTTGFSRNLRCAVFEKVNSLTFEEFSLHGTASLLTRSTEDVWMLQETASNIVYAIVVTPMLFIGGIIMAFLADPTLALILLGISPVILFIVWLITRRMFKLWENSEKYCDLQSKVMRERLSGLRVIRSFNKEPFEHERVKNATETMATNIIKANVLSGMLGPISSLLLNLASVLILYIGAERIQVSSILTAGSVIATVQYVALIMNGLMVISIWFLYMPQVKIAVKRIAEVFAFQGVENGEKSDQKLSGDIKFENVDFYYPKSENPTLRGINIDVKAGEVVGIIGGTGCGKTTLMKLLMSFYSPTNGKAYFGGEDMTTLSKATVRDNISIALQKAMIFQGSIGYNIKLGKNTATDEEVSKVAQIAQLAELLTSNSSGMDYNLTQAGANISGGQKQRINIARTIIKDASVYVFDDSFSALDFLTESRLRKQLNKYLSGKTQFVITQRAATAMRCDKVYVMDRGEIVGSGTHAQLLKTCSIYKEIYDSQLGGNKNVHKE